MYQARYMVEGEEDVVADMLCKVMEEVYPKRSSITLLTAQFLIREWHESYEADVMVALQDDAIVGFSVGNVEDFRMMLEPFYLSILTYILPGFRNTQAVKTLMHILWRTAYRRGLSIESSNMSPKMRSIASKYGAEVVGNVAYVPVYQEEPPL